MNKLQAMTALVDVDVSPQLRKGVLRLTRDYTGLALRQRYSRMKALLDRYQEEKVPPKGIEPWQLLCILFSAMTGKPEDWRTSKFTYYFHIGRSEIADVIWEVATEEGVEPATIQIVHGHAKVLSKEKGIPLLDAFQRTLLDLKKIQKPGHEDEPWFKNLWESPSNPRWSLIRRRQGMKPKQPVGQRKRKAKKRTPRKRRRQKGTARERELSIQLREVFAAWLDERSRDVPEDFRDLERAVSQAEFNRTILFIQTQTSRAASDQQLEDRREYASACRVLGIEIPDEGLVSLRVVRPVYRGLAARLHPDHNPHLDDEVLTQMTGQFQQVVEAYKFILAYNERNA